MPLIRRAAGRRRSCGTPPRPDRFRIKSTKRERSHAQPVLTGEHGEHRDRALWRVTGSSEAVENWLEWEGGRSRAAIAKLDCCKISNDGNGVVICSGSTSQQE